MCPIFDNSASNRLTRYQKILWVCSLGSKNLLNFTWVTMKFHDPDHAISCASVIKKFSWSYPQGPRSTPGPCPSSCAPRMYPRSGFFLVHRYFHKSRLKNVCPKVQYAQISSSLSPSAKAAYMWHSYMNGRRAEYMVKWNMTMATISKRPKINVFLEFENGARLFQLFLTVFNLIPCPAKHESAR